MSRVEFLAGGRQLPETIRKEAFRICGTWIEKATLQTLFCSSNLILLVLDCYVIDRLCFDIGLQRPQLVKGNMQLFSVEQQRSQALEAHAASFATFKVISSENRALSRWLVG